MGKFKERVWYVPEDLPERWRDRVLEQIDPGVEAAAFSYAMGHLHDLGGNMKIAPLRVEIAPERYLTLGYRFMWTLFGKAHHFNGEPRLEVSDPSDEQILDDAEQEPEPSIVDPEPVEA